METKNYSQFKFHKANRPINESLVKKLTESIKNFGFIDGRPVLVDKDFTVIDGQHRLEACKRLEIPVQYQVSDAKIMDAVIALNSSQVQWKLIDYINSHAEQGVDCYRKLLKFEEKYKLGMSNSVDVFLQIPIRSTAVIKKGQIFPINTQCDQIAEYIDGIKTIGFNRHSSFVRAITYLFKKGHTKYLNRIREKIILVPYCRDVKEYLIVFENIVNAKKRGKNRINL